MCVITRVLPFTQTVDAYPPPAYTSVKKCLLAHTDTGICHPNEIRVDQYSVKTAQKFSDTRQENGWRIDGLIRCKHIQF